MAGTRLRYMEMIRVESRCIYGCELLGSVSGYCA